MATMDQESTKDRGQSSGGQANVGSPISNDAYNVLTALQAKLEGLEAYRKYASDGSNEIWSRLMQPELDSVEVLVGELERIVRDGRLRADGGKARS